MRTWRRVLVCGAATTVLGCTRLVGGAAELPPTELPGPLLPEGVDVEAIMLDTAQMRGITGAGDNLTVIPTMDTKVPVDVGALADTGPAQCRFFYAETATFGDATTQFHKTTFQYPLRGALISEAAAAYPDPAAARRTFDALVGTVGGCADTPAGPTLVGRWVADAQSLRTRAGDCGRDYRLKAATLLEVTFCRLPASVSDIVLGNLAANVPG